MFKHAEEHLGFSNADVYDTYKRHMMEFHSLLNFHTISIRPTVITAIVRGYLRDLQDDDEGSSLAKLGIRPWVIACEWLDSM
ncbi:hypothetical protein OUZ56_000686 [Daphnia magna]|uniref:Uncharacterized protein n=1 Tax=Daphnia magna TaxID=35525 RepID=A0ABR0A0M4_9CRUS|nr:hypothetical protein OUZ56_000686 [Daphnia magna]